MRRIVIETSIDLKHVAAVGAHSPLDDMSNHTATSLVKRYDNGIVVYRAPFDRFLITVPEAHPLFGLYALSFNRNDYIGNALPEERHEAIKRAVRDELTITMNS